MRWAIKKNRPRTTKTGEKTDGAGGKNISFFKKFWPETKVPGTKKAKILAPYNSAWHRKGTEKERWQAVVKSFVRLMKVFSDFGQSKVRPEQGQNENWKGAVHMRRKLFAIFGVLLMSVSLFAGCNANDNDPPPEDDTEINDDVRDDGVRDNDADLNDGVDRDRTDDGDVIEDDNTPGEEIIEDTEDARDRDNRDE